MKRSFLKTQTLVALLAVLLIAPSVSMAQQSAAKDSILNAFHEQKNACKQTFFDALAEFQAQKAEIVAMIKQATDTNMVAMLRAEIATLEAIKDEAEIAKDQCIADAEAAKNAALAAIKPDEDEEEGEGGCD